MFFENHSPTGVSISVSDGHLNSVGAGDAGFASGETDRVIEKRIGEHRAESAIARNCGASN